MATDGEEVGEDGANDVDDEVDVDADDADDADEVGVTADDDPAADDVTAGAAAGAAVIVVGARAETNPPTACTTPRGIARADPDPDPSGVGRAPDDLPVVTSEFASECTDVEASNEGPASSSIPEEDEGGEGAEEEEEEAEESFPPPRFRFRSITGSSESLALYSAEAMAHESLQ